MKKAHAKLQTGADALTRLIVAVFRFNGALLAAGDRLTEPIGLTSSRWQVLGTIATAECPLTMAAIARAMGLTRQNVRIIVRELEAKGMVRYVVNLQDQRAALVATTPKGESAHLSAKALQKSWAKGLSRSLEPELLDTCTELMQVLRNRLDTDHKEKHDA